MPQLLLLLSVCIFDYRRCFSEDFYTVFKFTLGQLLLLIVTFSAIIILHISIILLQNCFVGPHISLASVQLFLDSFDVLSCQVNLSFIRHFFNFIFLIRREALVVWGIDALGWVWGRSMPVTRSFGPLGSFKAFRAFLVECFLSVNNFGR